MLELFGAIAITLIAIVLIIKLIGYPWLGIAFGGWKGNGKWLVFGVAASFAVLVGWWFLVGTHIHFDIGVRND